MRSAGEGGKTISTGDAGRPRHDRSTLWWRSIRIVAVVGRHGLADQLGRALDRDDSTRDQRTAGHLRRALEELGPTFIKLGQLLSTRADLLSPVHRAELAHLQDDAPVESLDAVTEVVVSELGAPLERLFASFEATPLAAASIGQAHAAVLPDGTEVVVKVRRPHAVEQVGIDLEVLGRLAEWATRHSSLARRWNFSALADELARTLRSELDYRLEATHAERFARELASLGDVHVPLVDRARSTSQVITLERIRGIKISDLAALEAAGFDPRRLARRVTEVILTMVFEQGHFHADPHPGNLFVEADGRLGIIDFGMVGTLSPALRARLARFFVAYAALDAATMAGVTLELGAASGEVDRAALERDLAGLVAAHQGTPLGEVRLAALLHDLLNLVRRHHLRLPADLALLAKASATTEGLAMLLDPTLDVMSVFIPFAVRLTRATADQTAGGDWMPITDAVADPTDRAPAPSSSDRRSRLRRSVVPLLVGVGVAWAGRRRRRTR